jgi:hypothetical protein
VRRAATAFLALALALAAAGCGGGDEESVERSPAVERLAELCEEAREDVEALGLPADVGPSVIGRWAARGARLAGSVKAMDAGTPAERRQIRALASDLEQYYRGLALAGAAFAQSRSMDVYAASIDRADAFRDRAERRALRLGAAECARRPFDDDPAP